jgi:hypothetical protein
LSDLRLLPNWFSWRSVLDSVRSSAESSAEATRVMLDPAYKFDLALQLDQFLGALVNAAQNLKPDGPLP